MLLVLASLFFVFSWSVIASQALYRDILKNAPASYFGFHYMIPLFYRNGIQSSVVKELKAAFTDMRADTLDHVAFLKAQLKHYMAVDTVASMCTTLCKKSSMELPPHRFFNVDEVFCAGLQSQMYNWNQFMSLFLPNPAIFIEAKMDYESIKSIDAFHIVEEVEPKLGKMANEILRIFEENLSQYPGNTIQSPTSMNAALQVLTDISQTLKSKLVSVKISKDFQARFYDLLSLYINLCLPFKYLPLAPDSAVRGMIPFRPESKEFLDFFICRYDENLSISECARHINFIGRSNLSLVELVNTIHAIQFQHKASTGVNQRFLTFLLKGLVHEHHLSTPDLINPKLREHLLKSVPVYSNHASRKEYCLHRHARSGKQFMPQIFYYYIDLKRPHLVENFFLHYTFFDLIRMSSGPIYTPIHFSQLTSQDQDLIDFLIIYNRINKIIHEKSFFFKSLFAEEVDLFESFRLFLDELAGVEDPHELLECTKQLILFYQKLYSPDPRFESTLLIISSIWFDLRYLKESTIQ